MVMATKTGIKLKPLMKSRRFVKEGKKLKLYQKNKGSKEKFDKQRTVLQLHEM